jgi:hypothetical protein
LTRDTSPPSRLQVHPWRSIPAPPRRDRSPIADLIRHQVRRFRDATRYFHRPSYGSDMILTDAGATRPRNPVHCSADRRPGERRRLIKALETSMRKEGRLKCRSGVFALRLRLRVAETSSSL